MIRTTTAASATPTGAARQPSSSALTATSCYSRCRSDASTPTGDCPQCLHSRRLVDKLWSYCNVLRDDGVVDHEYIEQLTYLLFLKMADERARGR